MTSLANENNKSKFWGMKGSLVTHPCSDSEDFSCEKLFELKNKKGLTLWYGQEVLSEVCLTGLCKVVHIWVFWDCLGNYLGLELFEGEPLTKTDHDVFSEGDYARLDLILRDTTSVFKELKYEDLIDPKEMEEVLDVDGFSGATAPSLRDYAVDRAIYTCYSLWHAVYGASRKRIALLNQQHIDKGYILELFNQKETHYRLLAIQLAGKSQASLTYEDKVLAFLSSDQYSISTNAFEFVEKRLLTNINLQQKLVSNMRRYAPNLKTRVIWTLRDIPHLEDEVILSLLNHFEKGVIGATSLGTIYQMIDSSHLENEKIKSRLRKNQESENSYVSRITEKLLMTK